MQNENKAYPMSRLLEEKSACPRQKPLLFGEIDSTDVIKERKVKSLINNQINLFDIYYETKTTG